MEDLIYIGNISKTHKLAGALKVHTKFNNLEDLILLNVFLKKDDDYKLLKIKNIRNTNSNSALFEFENIDNIDEAKKLISYKIYVRKDLVPNYVEEENYISYEVYQENEFIGLVEDILETAAHEILVVDHNGSEVLIPFIDVFVKEIDNNNRKINVKLIEGMI